MSRLGIGLAALGRPAYITLGHGADLPQRSPHDLAAHTSRMLDLAVELDVRYLDAARSYGHAEEFVGAWLARTGRRGEVTVSSKWGYTYVADWRLDAAVHEVKEHSVAAFDRQWPATLEALGGRPDVYLVHSVTPDSPALTDPEILDRLAGLAADGVRVGLSTSGPGQGRALRAALALGNSSPYSAVQATWNLLETSAAADLAAASRAGWLVVVKEALANGRLTDRGGIGPLAAAARERSTTPDAVALAAALAQPWADVVLLGATTTEQLRSNVAARTTAPPTPGELDLATDPEDYWAARSALPWT